MSKHTIDIADFIAPLLAGKGILLLGNPGTGKTDMSESLIAAYWAARGEPQPGPVITLEPETQAPEEGTGVPDKQDNGNLRMTIPEGSPLWDLQQAIAAGTCGGINIDDLDKGNAPVQRVYMRMVRARKCGLIRIPASIPIVASANRNGQGGEKIIGPLLTRFGVFEWHISCDQWLAYQDKRPSGVPAGMRAWLHANPDSIETDADGVREATAKQEPYPCPRSLSALADVLVHAKGEDSRRRNCVAFVGTAAGEGIHQYDRLTGSLPSIKAAIANPDNLPLPKTCEAKLVFACQLGVLDAPQHVEAVLRYAQRMGGDYVGIAYADMVRRTPSLRLLADSTSRDYIGDSHPAISTVKAIASEVV